ncbi:YceD family protein [Streptacidiphilus monticola]|uniref:YceD family protein n=1 Tax=Streptacidiphilus monticola TaxID=2161674 RepID=A0ABW1FXN7_9ACTN
MRTVTRSVPAPADLGNEVIAVPEGSPIELELRLESVIEGVLVTGTASASAKGECVRCLEPVEEDLDVRFQELYYYPEAADRFGGVSDSDEEEEDEEASRLEGDLFDLEPVLRDAVVLALPLQPVDQDDCLGLCSECGARLSDDPDHHHDAVDPRWAALQGLSAATSGADDEDASGTREGAAENQEK